MQHKRQINPVSFLIFLLIICVAVAVCLKKPHYNWDILGYVAVALSTETNDPRVLHARSYETVKEVIPPDAYADLVDPAVPFREKMASDPEAFRQVVPYYRIRPLYNLAVWLLYKAGANAASVTVWVSVVAYGVLALLLYFWMSRHLDGLLCLGVSSLCVLSGPLLEVGRLSSPDAFSAAILVASLYAVAVGRPPWIAAALGFLSIFVRSDNVVFAGLLILWLWLNRTADRRLHSALAIALLVVSSVSYLLINKLAGHYGWSTVFYHSFVEKVYTPEQMQVSVSPVAYAKALVRQGVVSVRDSTFALMALLGMLGWMLARRQASLAARVHLQLMVVAAVSIVVHFLAFPVLWDRLFVAPYVLVMVVLVAAVRGGNQVRAASSE